MRVRILIALAGATVLLAGCFTSTVPLITPENADYPFTTLVLRSDEGLPATIVRDGDAYAYADTGGGDEIRFLLDDYGDGLFLLQMISEGDDGTPQQLYGVVLINEDEGVVALYRTVVNDTDFAAGIPHCVENGEELFLACLTDGQQLIDIVVNAIAAGEAPEGAFTIVSTE
ncbi:MAG: hypothetical protein AB7O56_09780 [Bauldia sp.]